VLDAVFAVRTGEDTFFANVLCRAGVPFELG
jgi:D-ribose pyranase